MRWTNDLHRRQIKAFADHLIPNMSKYKSAYCRRIFYCPLYLIMPILTFLIPVLAMSPLIRKYLPLKCIVTAVQSFKCKYCFVKEHTMKERGKNCLLFNYGVLVYCSQSVRSPSASKSACLKR